MKTIKKGRCPGLSGTNELTYEIGVEQDWSYWLPLIKSDGGGISCKECISIDKVMDILRQSPSPFASHALSIYFRNRSVNTQAFVMAVLKHEGLVVSAPDKKPAFVMNGINGAMVNFQARMFKTIYERLPSL